MWQKVGSSLPIAGRAVTTATICASATGPQPGHQISSVYIKRLINSFQFGKVKNWHRSCLHILMVNACVQINCSSQAEQTDFEVYLIIFWIVIVWQM